MYCGWIPLVQTLPCPPALLGTPSDSHSPRSLRYSHSARSKSAAISHRIPQIFLGPISTSLGHFTWATSLVKLRRDCATATAAIIGTFDASCGLKAGRSKMVNIRLAPFCCLSSSDPVSSLPAVCSSAMYTVLSLSPFAAKRLATSLVLSTLSKSFNTTFGFQQSGKIKSFYNGWV